MSYTNSHLEFARLIHSQRVASLGTLRNGGPLVSMVPFVATDNFSAFLIHISRLAQHTQDILQDPRVGLMIAVPDDGIRNPQTLPRVSIQGQASVVRRESAHYDEFADRYLQKFPDAAMTFSLGDFDLYRIDPQSARFVAGFGQIYNFGPLDFQAAAVAEAENDKSDSAE